MKILNLYSGIGGNRKLWGHNHEITAIECDEHIAKIYKDFYPNDNVIVADAHEYLLKHYKEFEFIWSSPPCPTHSDIRRCGVHAGQYEALFPDMTLYQEIILLQNFAKCNWVIENVKPYYEPLIRATSSLQRHLFWSNFNISKIEIFDSRKHSDISANSIIYDFDLSKYSIKDKRKILRNCVNPELGLHILNQSMGVRTKTFQLELAL